MKFFQAISWVRWFCFIISFKPINFAFQIFHFLVPKCSTDFVSEILQIISIDLAWILQPL
jgi:hypothetical protein